MSINILSNRQRRSDYKEDRIAITRGKLEKKANKENVLSVEQNEKISRIKSLESMQQKGKS